MEAANKRIDAQLLGSSQGKLVRTIGQLESYDPSAQSAVLNSNGSINLSLGQTNGHMEVGKKYEILGRVDVNSLTVKVYTFVELSDSTNLEAATKLAHYADKVPELFFQSSI